MKIHRSDVKSCQNVLSSGRIPSMAAGGASIGLFSPATLNHTHFYDICRRIGGAQDWGIKERKNPASYRLFRCLDAIALPLPSFISLRLKLHLFAYSAHIRTVLRSASIIHASFLDGQEQKGGQNKVKVDRL